MITRKQIESILKLNGVEEASPDDLIRSVLLSASFDKNEVDSALMVLRKNIKTNQTRIDGLHKVFRTDTNLRPEEVSQLLGIEVDISEKVYSKPRTFTMSNKNYVTVLITSLIVSSFAALVFMYLLKVGIFHPSSYI